MSQVFSKLYLDVRLNNKDIITEAVQGDTNSRFLDVYLLDNGTPINLTGHEVRMYGVRGDTTEFYNNGTITEAANGRCQFELTSQALSAANDIKAQVIIYFENTQVLQTAQFTIKVTPSLVSDSAIPSSNEYGALVVLFQELYEAKDQLTDVVQNFGEKGAIATARDLNTFWKVMEYVAKYMDTDLTNLLNYVLENADVIGVINRLGETDDTGGTDAAGTVYAKLNSIISGKKYKSFKRASDISLPANATDYTLLSVMGAGEFYGALATCTDLTVTIDGNTTMTASGSPSTSLAFIPYVPSGIGTRNTSSDSSDLSHPMPFKSSLVITANAGSTATGASISYALYE